MLPALPPAHPSSLPPEAADVTTNICHYVWVLEEEGTDLIALSWAVLVWDSPSREAAWGGSQAVAWETVVVGFDSAGRLLSCSGIAKQVTDSSSVSSHPVPASLG